MSDTEAAESTTVDDGDIVTSQVDDQQGLNTEAADGFTFNMAETDEDAGFEPMPVGTYDAVIETLTFGLSKSSQAPMWTIMYAITGPEQWAEKNRKQYHYVSFKEDQRGRAKKVIKAFAPELLTSTSFDPERIAGEGTLIGRPVRLRLGIGKPTAEYPTPRNDVKDVLPPTGPGQGGAEGGGNFNL